MEAALSLRRSPERSELLAETLCGRPGSHRVALLDFDSAPRTAGRQFLVVELGRGQLVWQRLPAGGTGMDLPGRRRLMSAEDARRISG